MAGCISHVKKSVPKSIDKAECGLRTETRRAREREQAIVCVFARLPFCPRKRCTISVASSVNRTFFFARACV